MKILLFSDSHGNINNMNKVIDKNPEIDNVIHLGDFVKDVANLMQQHKNIHFEFVKGNNDWSENFPVDKLLDICGKKVFITHGHLYGVKMGVQKIIEKGKLLKADAVFFGHTHIPFEQSMNGPILINPGTIGDSANNVKPTYCLVTFSENKFSFKFLGV